MNETQLHDRLTDLADELAPDADPYAQASGARSLHRRQRRTRVGLAGLAAAIAAVVVGVPLGIGALSSDPATDVAGPSPAEEAPVYSGDPALRSLVEQLDAELGDSGLVALPDLSASERAALSDGPCPQAAELLSERLGVSVGPVARAVLPGPTIGTACSYSRAWHNNGPNRLALGLSSSPDADAWPVDPTDLPAGCATATLPDSARTYVLLCRGEVPAVPGTYADQLMWRVVVPDTTGGFWGLTALVGTGYPDRTGIDAVVALRDVVQNEFATEPATAGGDDQYIAEHAARIAEMVPNLSLGAPAELSCPDASPDGFDLEFQPKGPPTGLTYCHWSAGAPDSDQPAPLGGSIQYSPDGPLIDGVWCPTAPVPGSTPLAELKGCKVGEFVAWTLVVPAADGPGGWVISASGGVVDTPDSAADGPSSLDLLFALVQVADETW